MSNQQSGNEKSKSKSQKLQTMELNGKNYILLDKYFYNPDDVIGEGAFGKVYRGFNFQAQKKENDKECAIKKMELPENMALMSDREKMTLDAVRKEICALKLLKHPNIVKLYDVKKLQNVIYMVMELCNEKSLSEFIKENKDITEPEIRYKFGEVLNGFKYLRSKQIIHRDVKPENILIRKGVLKIADFGFAKQHNSKTQLHSYLGTRATIAPQVILGDYTDKCDIWSLGATLYFMCFKKYPYKEFYASEIKLMELMKRDFIEFPKNGMQVSQPLQQIIVQMMRYREEDRIDWNDLFACPLFQNKLLKEMGLNIFEYHESQDDSVDINDAKIDDFDFEMNDHSEQEIERINENANVVIYQAEKQRKNEEIFSKLISRLTFEKGKCMFLRLLSQRVKEYELTLSNKLIFEKSKVDISDHLKSLRFGLNKFELIINRGLVEWMEVNKNLKYYCCWDINNPIGVNDTDWENFLTEGLDREKIKKALEKELNITQQYVYNASQDQLQQFQQMNEKAFQKLNVNKEFMSSNFECNKNFFKVLYDLSLGLARLLFPEIVKIRNNLDSLHKVLPTLVLVDDLFILLTLDSVFSHTDSSQVNYTAFFELRKKNYSEDQIMYKTMYQRVMRAYEVFFE
ncbi:unnamed protein product [Paramecium primaurelia]|uniref:Protein kinase domain-containing protein n=1 Tax=Paramecium primaurelia TaxID=5886 RepID=A0A8S1K3W0_PARPR|nr:unnamed protein product [Paramecium primaurelia]